ncbi:MAG: sensor histidine kinase [Anaerolineales bacterium]|nr:MAG: sensor histidine kinase [Anaerolineales bacterium]
MEQSDSYKSQFVGFPFYIFITILLGLIAVFSLRDVWNTGSLFFTALCFLLFASHIGLYWLNLRTELVRHRLLVYYAAQAMLIVALVSIPYGTPIYLMILGSAVITIIADVLGWWGNTRRALYLGLFYLALTIALILLRVPASEWGTVIVNLLINGGFIILFMVVLNQQLAERQKAVELAESLESANAKLAAYNAKIESLTLQNERQRMARELHDTLAQGVAGLVLQLEAIKAHLAAENTERATAIVEQSIARARSTLAESRAVIDDLRSAPANVTELMREKVERFKQSTGIPCELEISVSENQLPAETLDHAMNILSESLTNIARHAQATNVNVKFFIQNKTLELEVRDNGIGFDVKQEAKGHYGLVGMHERARLTGGMLSIESDAGGTCVQFVVGRSL